jgi:hypothetical protein
MACNSHNPPQKGGND